MLASSASDRWTNAATLKRSAFAHDFVRQFVVLAEPERTISRMQHHALGLPIGMAGDKQLAIARFGRNF